MKKKPPPPEELLGVTGFWRPTAAARGGGWATAATLLLLLLVSHLGVLLVRLRFRHVGRIARPEAAAAAPVPASASPGSASGLEGLVMEGDLRQLVGNLGVGGREPETEGWEHVISKGNDDSSYRVWCDKPTNHVVGT